MSILKKIFFLSLFFLFLSTLFWGIYMLSFKKNLPVENKSSIAKNPPSSLENPDDKPAPEAKISVISQESVLSPVLSPDENSIWYYSLSGELKEIDFFGKTTKKLTTKKIINLIGAIWSPDKSKALLEIGQNHKTDYLLLFDRPKDQLIFLNKNINCTSWLASSDRIIYKYFDSKNNRGSLNISAPDGSNWKKLLDLPHDKIVFSQIPLSGLISFWNNGDAYYPTLFQSMSLIGENTKTLSQNYFGADYLWNQSGNRVLTSQTDAQGGTKMQLGVMNYNGGEYKNLGLPTFVSKCLWSKDNENIYCALPGNIPDNSILPNDYKLGKFTTTDTFWKINITTSEKTRLLETKDISDSFDASDFFASTDESLIFFVNKKDGKLYKIVL
ncbi:MAG: hypothetical protein COX29_02785 [Candidatus Moranbacteria bacterium CG23_combo_of_CG06-09_8_20_14_all_35_22]|nr:MAG: hypothetical protein COX29_02785 [Candidatus Moranbacteria bacterium CG23_combo_of_CG06-09_8_20_14_all_35_22]